MREDHYDLKGPTRTTAPTPAADSADRFIELMRVAIDSTQRASERIRRLADKFFGPVPDVAHPGAGQESSMRSLSHYHGDLERELSELHRQLDRFTETKI